MVVAMGVHLSVLGVQCVPEARKLQAASMAVGLWIDVE